MTCCRRSCCLSSCCDRFPDAVAAANVVDDDDDIFLKPGCLCFVAKYDIPGL